MNKVIGFMKKHWIMKIIFGGAGGILLLKVITFLSKMVVAFIVGKSKNAICYVVSQQLSRKYLIF
ncbi:MAG: hypothetical protein PHT76_01260 [Anaerostipes sp.]|nr:hypothetical protein [Anaerostipes sp.]